MPTPAFVRGPSQNQVLYNIKRHISILSRLHLNRFGIERTKMNRNKKMAVASIIIVSLIAPVIYINNDTYSRIEYQSITISELRRDYNGQYYESYDEGDIYIINGLVSGVNPYLRVGYNYIYSVKLNNDTHKIDLHLSMLGDIGPDGKHITAYLEFEGENNNEYGEYAYIQTFICNNGTLYRNFICDE